MPSLAKMTKLKLTASAVASFASTKKAGISTGTCSGGLRDLIMTVAAINATKTMISGMPLFIKMEFFIYYP